MLFSLEPKKEQKISLRMTLSWVRASLKEVFYLFLKSDLKWDFFQLLLHIFLFIWIKYITRHFKTQIDEKKIISLSGARTHESTIYLQGRNREIFRSFFGSSENSKKSFRNQLTFRNLQENIYFFVPYTKSSGLIIQTIWARN